MFSKLLGLILFAFIARFLGANELGLYAFAIALANFFAIATRFGFEKRVEKEVGRNTRLLYSYFREINSIKAIFSICSLALLWLLLQLVGEADSPMVMLIACFVFTFTFLEFTNALFRGIGKAEFEVFARTVFSLLNTTLGIAALFAGWGLQGVVTAQLISVSTAILYCFFIVRKVAIKTSYSGNWRTLWSHVKATAPFAVMLFTLYFGNQITIVLIQALTRREEVGYFAASMRLFESLTPIPAAIAGAFLPVISRLYSTSVDGFAQILRFAVKYLFVISSPIVLGAILIAPQAIPLLYGEEFMPSVIVLQILLVALIFSFWNNSMASALIASNREKLLIWLFACGAVFHVGANLLLIPMLSFVGAAWAMLASCAVLFIGNLVCLRRHLKIGVFFRDLASPALCAAAMGIVVFTIRDWNIGLVIPIGAIVYIAALFLTGTASRRDLDSLKGTIGAP